MPEADRGGPGEHTPRRGPGQVARDAVSARGAWESHERASAPTPTGPRARGGGGGGGGARGAPPKETRERGTAPPPPPGAGGGRGAGGPPPPPPPSAAP